MVGMRQSSPRWFASLASVPLAVALALGPSVAPSLASIPADGTTPVVATAAEAAAPLPDPVVLAAKLKKVSTKGIGTVGLLVTTTDGTVLADRAADVPLTPASTMKVLTTMAALDALGPDRTFATRVLGSASSRIYLVGGGDPLLTDKTSTSSYKPASLQKLAKATVAALKAAGRTSVRLRYDASLFTGPTWSGHWKSKWKGWEAKVAALEIDSGKLSSGRAAYSPAKTAATAFAKRLKAAGIKVISVASATAPADGPELAPGHVHHGEPDHPSHAADQRQRGRGDAVPACSDRQGRRPELHRRGRGRAGVARRARAVDVGNEDPGRQRPRAGQQADPDRAGVGDPAWRWPSRSSRRLSEGCPSPERAAR